jgi:pentatricopeptide repeat protein
MYANCGIVTEAHTVFANLLDRNIISWGAILATLIEEGDATHALLLIDKLQEENLTFDQAIWLTAVQACGIVGSIKKLHLFHEQMKGTIFKNDLVIGNALIDMYSISGAHSEALKVFNNLPSRDEISWGTVINCQAQHGDSHVVIDLFLRMLEDKIAPNDVIFSCFLKACGDIRVLQEAHLIHDFLIKSRLKATNAMLNSLINMYVNCMSLIEAQAVFEGMQSKDEISWSVFIAGHALAGNWSMIVHYLDEMQRHGLSPTSMLFVTILGACSKGGYLEEGCKIFMMMTRYFPFTPNIEHYNCMIDLLARAGHLVDAIHLMETMPISVDLLGWTSLLANCHVYGNVDIGRICFEQVMQLDPNNVLAFDVMTSLYMDAGLWEDINRMDEMKTSTVKFSKDFKAVGIP